MNAAEAQELGGLEPGNRSKDFLLRAGLQACLEAHEIPHLRRAVFLPELHDRVGRLAASGIYEPNRLHRPKPQRLDSTLRNLFDRQAAFEVGYRVEFMTRHVLLAG